MDGSDEPKVPDGTMRPRGLISPISPISPIGLMSLPGTPWKIKSGGATLPAGTVTGTLTRAYIIKKSENRRQRSALRRKGRIFAHYIINAKLKI